MKFLLVLAFSLFLIDCYGQLDCCFYSDKPITAQDSMLWRKNGIERIEKYYQYFNAKDTTAKLQKVDTLSAGCLKLYCLDRQKQKVGRNKSKEILVLKSELNNRIVVKLKRTIYSDDEGKIVRIKNQFVKGQRNEQWLFDHVDFQYKDGLLLKSIYHSKLYGNKRNPFLVIHFKHV